jgi:hypothetical protein
LLQNFFGKGKEAYGKLFLNQLRISLHPSIR